MTVAVGVLNVILGLVYCQYGTMTLLDMRRQWKTMGFSHFGAAWIAMAFTCGPHHFVHGLHLLATGGHTDPLDLAAVVIGFPAGVIWFALRVEAFTGGAGDRFIKGTPPWVLALPVIGSAYLATIITIVVGLGHIRGDAIVAVAPNVLLVGIYCTIGYYLARTQLANRRPLGGWSASGLALAVIFPTCAMMHAVYAYYAVTGAYATSGHTTAIDWLAVPAGAYFLWVVQALFRGAFRDWNRGTMLRAASEQVSRA